MIKIGPIAYVIAGLLFALLACGLVIKSQRADIKVLEAKVQPLENALADSNRISEGHRTALNKCEAEKLRVAEANAKAAADAAANAQRAAEQAEDFFRTLANPPPGEQCEAFLASRICPALMDY